jgi:hypothetical protein
MLCNISSERHLSKRLFFFVAAKITFRARFKKNVIYIAKMVGKIGNFVCFLYFYDHFGPPVAMTRSSLTETMPPIKQQAGIRLALAQQAYQAS